MLTNVKATETIILRSQHKMRKSTKRISDGHFTGLINFALNSVTLIFFFQYFKHDTVLLPGLHFYY